MTEVPANRPEINADASPDDSGSPGPSKRPHVSVDPAMRFGRPNVRGVSVETLTDLYAAGEPIEGITDDFGITRGDFLVACWYAGLYGTRTEKAWLKAWARRWQYPEMAHGNWADVEDPPAKPKRVKGCAVAARHDPQFWRGAGLSWWRCTCGVAAEFHYRTATGAQLAYGWHLLAVERLRGAP